MSIEIVLFIAKVFISRNCIVTWMIGIISMVVKSNIKLCFAFTNVLNLKFCAFYEIYTKRAVAVSIMKDLINSFAFVTLESGTTCNLFAT